MALDGRSAAVEGGGWCDASNSTPTGMQLRNELACMALAAGARANILAQWDARFGVATAPPSALDTFTLLLPPILLAGATHAGSSRLLRALALALASIASPDPALNYTSLATTTTDVSATAARAWAHQARRLAALAIAVLESSSDGGGGTGGIQKPQESEQRATQEQQTLAALPAVAARLVAALHNPAAWKCYGGGDGGRGGGGSGGGGLIPMAGANSILDPEVGAAVGAAAAAANALLDPDSPDGARQHSRLCSAVATLAGRGASLLAPGVPAHARCTLLPRIILHSKHEA